MYLTDPEFSIIIKQRINNYVLKKYQHMYIYTYIIHTTLKSKTFKLPEANESQNIKFKLQNRAETDRTKL